MKTVFITGANRGIGLALVSKFSDMGYKVYLGTRVYQNGLEAIRFLNNPANIIPVVINVEQEQSIACAYEYVKSNGDTIDIFINNSAKADWIPNVSHIGALEITQEELVSLYKVNVFASILTAQIFLPILNKGARIVNVSSGVGEFCDANADKDFQIGYAPSKSALLMTTKKLATALKPYGIYVNACCPDWCKTDMGGKDATNSIESGAESIIKACFIGEENPPVGGYFRHGNRVNI